MNAPQNRLGSLDWVSITFFIAIAAVAAIPIVAHLTGQPRLADATPTCRAPKHGETVVLIVRVNELGEIGVECTRSGAARRPA